MTKVPAKQPPVPLGPSSVEGLRLPSTGGTAPWRGLEAMPVRPDEFTFCLLSDRTGFARPGVFERAIEVANMLRPDFVVQIGDMIEGYTTDPGELADQWAEMDGMLAELQVPVVHVPGNHDVSNDVMRTEWLRRYGALHHHFVYRDVLFVVLDTQDPPQQLSEFSHEDDDQSREGMALFEELQRTDPEEAVRLIEAAIDWNGTMPAHLSDDQLDWFDSVLAEHGDVRWTVVCMHMPIWQDRGEEHPAFTRVRRSLAARRSTMFAGHVHNYRHTVIDGRDHIRLGPTGGLWVLSGEEGNFDHVTWVTMTPAGPRVANIVLEGVLPIEGGTFDNPKRLAPVVE